MAKYYNHPPSRTLEITILSGEDLRIDRRSVKKNAFVIVRTDTNNFRTTEMDDDGGSYPKWNDRLVLDLPAHAQAVTLEVHCKTAFGIKIVGTASVPVSDFAGDYLPESYLHFLSYRLRDSRGVKNGIINISVKTKAAAAAVAAVVARPQYSCSASASAGDQTTVGVPLGRSNFQNVVTGVPVWPYAYNNNRNF